MKNPLKAKGILGPKFTLTLLSVLLGPPLLYYSIVTPIVSKVVVPFPRVTGSLCYRDVSSALGYIITITTTIFIYVLHSAIDFVATIMIFMQIKTMNEAREKMSNVSSARSAKEQYSTITMLALAIIKMTIYGICLVGFLATVIEKMLPLTPPVRAHIGGIFLFIILCTIIPHCLNIFVYLILVPPFRKAALCIGN